MPIHSFLELLPLTGVLIVIILQWSQFLSLWGLGAETPRYWIVSKPDPLPLIYVAAFLFAAPVFELLPYLEECWWRRSHGANTDMERCVSRP